MRELLDPTAVYEMQVQENDLWLTAVAMAYNLIFVTCDKMERLKKITNPDVECENWLI